MAKVDFLLKSKLDNISVSELETLKKEYFELLESNKFPEPPKGGDFSDMIHYFKRKDENDPFEIGPYKNITPFEAANRIASDLVIINGLLQLTKELTNPVMTLRLGTTHVPGKGDFTIKIGNKEFEGEAFNVAPSFLKAKLQKTIRKWKGNDKLKYILINKDVCDGMKIDKKNIRIIPVENWAEKP
jgi:hypothetical protein